MEWNGGITNGIEQSLYTYSDIYLV